MFFFAGCVVLLMIGIALKIRWISTVFIVLVIVGGLRRPSMRTRAIGSKHSSGLARRLGSGSLPASSEYASPRGRTTETGRVYWNRQGLSDRSHVTRSSGTYC